MHEYVDHTVGIADDEVGCIATKSDLQPVAGDGGTCAVTVARNTVRAFAYSDRDVVTLVKVSVFIRIAIMNEHIAAARACRTDDHVKSFGVAGRQIRCIAKKRHVPAVVGYGGAPTIGVCLLTARGDTHAHRRSGHSVVDEYVAGGICVLRDEVGCRALKGDVTTVARQRRSLAVTITRRAIRGDGRARRSLAETGMSGGRQNGNREEASVD